MCTDVVKEYEKDGKVLKIFYDQDAESPREWDNLGTMVCWHRRYNLGDKHDYENPSDFWYSMAEDIVGDTDKVENMSPERREKLVLDKFIILPIYLYDHSGLAMNTTGYSCPWDSGQVGWVYVSKAKAREEYGVKKLTHKVREQVESVLKSEVEVYCQYVNGEVFGFVVEDNKGNMLDSCWGFYGHDFVSNGIVDQAGEEWSTVIN